MCCNEKLWKKLLITISTIALILILLCVCMGNSNGEIKSILSATAKEGDNTQIGETLIKFSTNEIIEGNAITHEEGSDSFIINESGIYQISYQLFGENQTLGTFNFNAVIIKNDGEIIETINESPILRDNVANRMTLTSTVVLRLQAGDVIKLAGLSIENIVYERARVDIVKLM